jgi:2-C-methyl-D-erythritol 4-phosphate cytidylyltransferase
MQASAIIVGAGRSARMGFDKLYAKLNGRPIISWSIARFEEIPQISEIVLVVSEQRRDDADRLVKEGGFAKVRQIVIGSTARHLSVWNGLQALGERVRMVAVHDAARPLVRVKDITSALTRAESCGAAALATPIVDTLKSADLENVVQGSVDRAHLWAMQTPQVFRRDWLTAAYKHLLDRGGSVTDEVSAVQALGHSVQLIQGDTWNLKITYPRDLELAEKLVILK